MKTTGVFNDVLEKIDTMVVEEQSLLMDILEKRYREKRREEILENAELTREEYRKGLTSKGNVSDFLKEIGND